MKIKMNFWYPVSSIILLFTALQSCENRLEVDPPINQINAAQVFEAVSTADAALSGLYVEMQAYSLINGTYAGTGALLGSYTDELQAYGNTQNYDVDLYKNVQTSENTRIKAVWNTAYKQIYMANAILEGVNNSTALLETDKKRIKGEALFIRSLLYYYLTQIFGDIPYATGTDYGVNQSLAKTSETEMLPHIKNDLLLANSLLSNTYRSPERIYPNRYSAAVLLATVYMDMHQWSDAEVLLKEVKQSPLLVWEPEVSKTFKMTGKHILWQLKPLKPGNATNEATIYHFTTAVPNAYSLSETLVNAFDITDLRRQNWIKTITINQKAYYKVDKYKNISSNSDECSVVFRLEEIYLLLAEALVQQNKRAEALPYLNAVKQKAGIAMVPENTSKEVLLNEILTENRKEFFTEKGIRFLSLKRAAKLETLNTAKPNWQIHHQRWPLPQSELTLNPRLNPQNNGY